MDPEIVAIEDRTRGGFDILCRNDDRDDLRRCDLDHTLNILWISDICIYPTNHRNRGYRCQLQRIFKYRISCIRGYTDSAEHALHDVFIDPADYPLLHTCLIHAYVGTVFWHGSCQYHLDTSNLASCPDIRHTSHVFSQAGGGKEAG